MTSPNQPGPNQPGWMTWTGRVLTFLIAALLVMSGTMKFSNDPQLLEGLEKMRISQATVQKIGMVELACAALYLIPQTTVLGAILVTGYLGGATFVHVQQGDPVGQILAPPLIGVVAWLGVYFRERRLRSLAPVRTKLPVESTVG